MMKSAKAEKASGKTSPVIEVLQKARAAELAAISQYMAQHYALDDADYGQVAAQLKLIAIDEMRHAEMFAERIYELGGVPTTEADAKAVKGQRIAEALAFDADLETKAVADYNEFMGVCVQHRDNISAKLFETITAEEQAHLTYFENVHGHIEELGAVYLAQLTGGPAETGAPARGFVAAKQGPAA